MIKLKQLVAELKYPEHMRIHMSKTPFELEKRMFTQRATMKPKGFWYGFGNEWIDWVRSEMPDWEGKYIYEVDIGNTNVLKIDTHFDLMKFHRKYAERKQIARDDLLDWSEVAKEYDGIEITLIGLEVNIFSIIFFCLNASVPNTPSFIPSFNTAKGSNLNSPITFNCHPAP